MHKTIDEHVRSLSFDRSSFLPSADDAILRANETMINYYSSINIKVVQIMLRRLLGRYSSKQMINLHFSIKWHVLTKPLHYHLVWFGYTRLEDRQNQDVWVTPEADNDGVKSDPIVKVAYAHEDQK